MKLHSSVLKYQRSNPRKRGWVQLAYMVISAALSYAAGLLLAKKPETPLRSDKPTTLTTRGSSINWWIGVRRLGPVFAWAGDREIRYESQGGGKGGPSPPDQEITYEAGWHIIGVGPAQILHKILQGSTAIFTGPITSASHPSGTTVDLGSEGAFTIYWGEVDQPINSFLGNANRVTISSRWPHICYVVWNKKRLTGESWPLINYVMGRHPTTSILTQSDAWYPADEVSSGLSYTVVDALADANEDVGYFLLDNDQSQNFLPGSSIGLSGTGMPNGLYQILRTETLVQQETTTPFDWFTTTRIFLEGGTLGATATGSLSTFISNDSTEGANAAHIIADLLFASFPQGLQLDYDHIVEKWDLDSLEDLGVEAEASGWRSSIVGTEGEKAHSLLGNLLQDHGVMLPIDTATGKLLFQRVREPSGTLSNLPNDIYADHLPEIVTLHGEQAVDRLIFKFHDRANGFGDMTIAVDDDGQASYMEHQRAREVPILSTVSFPTAAALSELRSPEELSQHAEFRISAGREARNLLPGQAITAEGFDMVLRVLGVDIDPLSERVELSITPDFYGVPKSSFETGEGKPPPTVLPPEQDEQFIWVEVPEHLLGGLGSTQTLIVPRIRAHSTISFTSLHLSRDNTTYSLNKTDTLPQTGGTLDDALSADGPTYIAQGPEFSELGPDNSNVLDYSADLTSWGLGKQVAVIWSAAGTEICFLQKATITGGSTRRLDGLLRGRYDTRKLDHPAGSRVFIFQSTGITYLTDSLLEPAEDLFVKSQPGTSAGQVNLSAVPPFEGELYGKGQVPIKPDYVYVTAPAKGSPSFQTGNDVTVSWAISSGTVGTGCGLQSAGTAIGAGVIPGTVTIEALTTGDVVKITTSANANDDTDYTFMNAALVAAFGGEPSVFKVRVTHVANGYSSDISDALTITRV